MSKKTDKAVSLFKSGLNCSQAVIGAFCDDFGIDLDTALRISSGFGGGIGRMRETCGAFSAVVMLAGLKYSQGNNGTDNRAEVYGIIQALAEEFRAENGSTICRELLGQATDLKESPVPENRTESYYKKRPCVCIVEAAAKIAEENLL